MRRCIFTLANSARRSVVSALRDATGGTAVEFSLLLPILVYFGIGVIDGGAAIYRQMQVQQAAQIGAEYAVINGFDSNLMSQAVVNGSSFSGVAASPAPSKFYGCVSSSVIVTKVFGDVCSDGSVAGTYVSVSASATYSTTLTYPSIPGTYSLLGVATVRIK